MGGLVVIYTVAGGTKAVSITQMQQMAVIFIGMFIAAFMVVRLMPAELSFTQSLKVAGKMGKLNVTDFSFDLKNQYNVWSDFLLVTSES